VTAGEKSTKKAKQNELCWKLNLVGAVPCGIFWMEWASGESQLHCVENPHLATILVTMLTCAITITSKVKNNMLII
jgi:hypothetical protein